MARTQSKKRRLFGFAQQSNSTPGLSLPPGTSQARAGGFASVSESSGMASAGKLARMRRLFHRSKRGTPATIASEVADREISGGVGEQREQLQAAPPQGVAATGTNAGAQDEEEKAQAVSHKDVCDLYCLVTAVIE
ncbi:hypothetical protein EDD16DRAFT_1726424 [Pisolithus croceorrhizus]|nr:hypothetical protein EDD16DRAFT_1726424 [Pisolithus croceorrhizus]